MEDNLEQPEKSEIVKKRRNYPSTITKRKSFKGDIPPGKKYCPECANILDIDMFKSRSGKIRHYCIPCVNKLERLRYQKSDGSYQRERSMKRNYNGFSLKEYQMMFDTQRGVCAACGQPETTNDPRTKQLKNLQIDHDHITGKVRALLCKECNNALGLLHDDPDRIRLLLRYAEFHQSNNCEEREGVEL